ncbi:hypothetical protein CPC08DRAFT_744681 [Agrocybe pediades]|nr:hypothetical protein CPC08DRAFT_744681 [Agrocybe pediades]
MATGSSVTFPVSEASPQRQGKPGSPIKPPHLPFRRISLPTAPSLIHRASVASVASFDSLPEDDDGSPRRHTKANPGKSAQGHVESPRRRRARDSSQRPVDDRQAAKRRKVIDEFYETEKAYVDGLELIYSNFLTPIIASLDTPEPLLNRSALTSIFSNFIDIWNLHRSFLSALTSLLEPRNPDAPPPELSPLLLSHFPYLSLYTPFVTAFPATISSLNELITSPSATRPNPQYNQRFASFLVTQEADLRCGKLKLRDWLLTIVQRCPRYLLLLKDLINSTSKDDPEHSQLTAVHTLVSKITLSLNTSLHTHAQTLALLALQRATPNLPFQLISPGRTLLKRGSLLQTNRNEGPVEREFLLFSDCLLWLAAATEGSGSSWDWSWSGSGGSASGRPRMTRTRSKSEAELPTLKSSSESGRPDSRTRVRARDSDDGGGSGSGSGSGVRTTPSSPVRPLMGMKSKSVMHSTPAPPPLGMLKRNTSSDDKWVYKGHVDLVDVEVVVGSALEEETRFEILSPEGSFALFAASQEERDAWTSEIRGAKAQLLVSLNITNPNSTLTSSASTNHVRKALQALPYPPSDERLATIRASASLDHITASSSSSAHGKQLKLGKKDKDKGKRGLSAERRRKVEHWVPAVWIPDGKTSSCMRCGRMFGWRRRRHHCRLCGRCVCSSCSGRTFFIADANSKSDSNGKPARACDACYETVFPLINPPSSQQNGIAEEDASAEQGSSDAKGSDTITSLAHLPSWLSMPALPVQRQPQALMAIDLNSSRDFSLDAEDIRGHRPGEIDQRRPRLRMKSNGTTEPWNATAYKLGSSDGQW